MEGLRCIAGIRQSIPLTLLPQHGIPHNDDDTGLSENRDHYRPCQTEAQAADELESLEPAGPPEDIDIFLESALSQSLALFANLADHPRDPITRLHEYYQKRKKDNIKPCFSEDSVLLKGNIVLWRCAFRCPITGTRVLSSVPAPVLMLEKSTLSVLDSVSTNYFGCEFRLYHGRVYFPSKKAAKKSCALAMLLLLDPDYEFVGQNTMVSSIDDLPLGAPPEHQPIGNEKDPQTPTTQVDDLFPSWVNRLAELGLHTADISYHEYHDRRHFVTTGPFEPTQLCCIISTDQLTVVGLPCSSKREARTSAVSLLCAEYIRQNPHSSFGDPRGKQIDIELKQNLIHCDSRVASYVVTHASSATLPFDERVHHIYELIFCDGATGKSWLAQRMFFTDCTTVTRLGVLFSRDVTPKSLNDVSFEATFQIRSADSRSEENVRVVLQPHFLADREAVNIMSRLDSLRRFNRLLMNWKSCNLFRKLDFKRAGSPLHPEVDADGQTCLFVPLRPKRSNGVAGQTDVAIDWDCIHGCLDEITRPLLATTVSTWNTPVGALDSRSVSSVALLLGAVVMDWNRVQMTLAALLVGTGLLALLLPFLRPTFLMEGDQLLNRWVVHRGHLYILQGISKCLHADSPFPNDGQEQEKVDWHIQHFQLDLRRTSFRNYFLKKFGLEIRFGSLPLLLAVKVQNLWDCDPLQRSSSGFRNHIVHLIPEFTDILAMPRDLVFIVSHAEKYLPKLERKIEIFLHTTFLQLLCIPGSNVVTDGGLFAEKVMEATTLYPAPTYERLEFLGDSVLSFFSALRAMSLNSSLSWNPTDLAEFVSKAGKNSGLVDASIRLGLPRLIHAAPGRWQSSYKSYYQRHCPTLLESVLSTSGIESAEVADSVLSDLFESFLAACYIWQKTQENDSVGNLVAYILHRAKVFATGNEQGTSLRSAPCLKRGFPFLEDELWSQRLTAFNCLFSADNCCNRLDECVGTLFETCHTPTAVRAPDRSQIFATLLKVALYNPRPEQLLEDSELVHNVLEISKELTVARGTLFIVGAFGLQVLLSEECFKRYPSAEPADLHLLRAVAIADDVIAYLAIKRAIHRCLFGSIPGLARFAEEVALADNRGSKVWSDRGGWIVGGLQEFRRRYKEHSLQNLQEITPCYPGICNGGRLVGWAEKTDLDVVQELAYSFKAIVGGLILCTGLEETWIMLHPFFAELMLLAPNDLRSEFSGSSTLVNSYMNKKANL